LYFFINGVFVRILSHASHKRIKMYSYILQTATTSSTTTITHLWS